MKSFILTSCAGLLLLSGCAGQTTDPRKGGLFSYDPDAYEQRLDERRAHLNAIEKENAHLKHKNKKLKQQL